MLINLPHLVTEEPHQAGIFIISFPFLNLRWMQVESKRHIQQSRCVDGPEPDPNPTCFDLPVICLGILTPTLHSKLHEIRSTFV